MPLTFFAGNKNQTGGILSVSFNSKLTDNQGRLDGSVFFRIVKQTGYDEQNKRSQFKNGETINIKITQDEIGSLIDAVRNRGQVSLYHPSQNEVTTGQFRYYRVEPKKQNQQAKEGFGLTVSRGETEVKIGFSLGSAERLAQYLEFALHHIFSAVYAEDKKQAEDSQKNGNSRKQPAKKASRKQQEEVEEEEEEIVSEDEDDSGDFDASDDSLPF